LIGSLCFNNFRKREREKERERERERKREIDKKNNRIEKRKKKCILVFLDFIKTITLHTKLWLVSILLLKSF